MDKQKVKEKQQDIIRLARALCEEKINKEYADLSEKLIAKMGRKRKVPFERGNNEIWATAVVHSLAGINFLYDEDFKPYCSFDEICSYYHCKKSTITNKATYIRRLMGLVYLDEEFSTKQIKEDNPVKKFILSPEQLVFIRKILFGSAGHPAPYPNNPMPKYRNTSTPKFKKNPARPKQNPKKSEKKDQDEDPSQLSLDL